MKHVFTLLLLALCASLAALAGSYTVGGSGANYATLTDAITALNSQGLTNHTEFILSPGTYNGPFVMQHQSNGYDLTVHSGTAPSGSVILNNPSADGTNNYIVKIDNVSDVKLQKLSFSTSGNYNVAVQINGNSDNTGITSCQFQGQVNASSNNSGAIYITASGSGDADNLYIALNSFYDGGYHITCNSSSYNDSFADWQILNNYFEDGYNAINLLRFTGLKVQDNNIITTTHGIILSNGSGGLEISGNKISGCENGIYGNYLEVNTSIPHIFNNIVSVTGSYGMSVYGVGLNIFHNSINNSSANSYNTFAGAFSGSNMIVRKNHFVTTGGGIALSATSVDPLYPQRNIVEHNNLYSFGLYVAKTGNDNYRELSDFAAVTQTQNISINPFFSTDLLSSVSPALDNMYPSTAVVTDYNGLPRNPVNSDIGAHEYTSDPALIPMSGNYYIGAGEAYTSIQAFCDALSLRGISATVNGYLTDALYQEQITAHAIPGADDDATVMLRSVIAGNSTISFSGQTAAKPYVMSMVRTKYIKLSNIIFSSTATSNSNLLLLNGFNRNLQFHYMQFNAPANTTGVSLGSSYGSEAKNLDIFSGVFSGNGFGIESRGENWDMYACSFDNQYQGVFGQSITGIQVENSSFTNARYYSINISTALNVSILQNRITGTKAAISLGTYGSTDTRSIIANNTVNVQGNSVVGISFSGNKITVLNNSAQVFGENSKGIYAYELGTDVDVVNNALGSDLGRALDIGYFSPASSKVVDYNCYYSEGNVLTKMGSDYASLSELQSAYPGYNQHSISLNPQFSADMHTQSAWLREAGSFRTEISTDMDGEPRGLSFDIGADQQTGEIVDNRLAGTYTIGAVACDYPSIQAAIADLELYGISASVTFNITMGSYPGYNTVRDFPKASPDLHVYFTALNGVSFSMMPINTYSYENYFFRLVGVKNLHFSGIDMALQASNKQSTFFVLNGRCENLSISEATFNLFNPLSSNNTGINTGDYRGTNLQVQNCSFENGNTGINIPGYYWDTLSYAGVEISNNSFSNVYYPISIQKAVDVEIVANTIDAAYQAISLNNISGNCQITRNRINSSGFMGAFNSNTLVNLYSCNGSIGNGFRIMNNIIKVDQSYSQSVTALSIGNSSHLYVNHNSIISDNSTSNEYGSALNLNGVSLSSFWNNIFSAPTSGYAATVSGCTDYYFQNNAWYNSGKYALLIDGTTYTAQSLLADIDPNGYFANPLPNANGYSQCSYLRDKAAASSSIADIDNSLWNGTPDIGASVISNAGSPISGTILVGAYEAYPSLAAAWDDLQKRGISGDTILQLSSGPMTTSAVLSYVPNSMLYDITIQGAEGENAPILTKTATTEADNFILKLYNTRNLKLHNLAFNPGNPTYSKCIEIQRYTNNFEILNCSFYTVANTQSSSYSAALYTSGAMLENCKIQDSTVQNLPCGLSLSAYQSQGISNTGVYISGNNFSGNFYGILLSNMESPQVLGNTISAYRYNGIYAGQGVNNLSIRANQVSGNGLSGINLYYLGSGIHELTNNFVSTGTTASTCIRVDNSPNVKLYHNTIVNSSADANAAAFYQSASSAGLAFVNNIAVAANGYAAWFNQLADFESGKWTHNLYYSSGANKVRLGGSTINSAIDWNVATGDQYSIVANPLLTNGGYQLSAGSPARNAGIYLSAVTLDILGQQRDNPPDMGCYESQLVTLAAPQNLQMLINAAQDTITLSWDIVPGAGVYYVQSASDPYATDWQNIPGASTGQLSISFPLPAEHHRFYRVVAIGAE
jgi:parallel beta-helix repeat protein